MEGVDSRKERLQKAFVDLDEKRTVLTECTVQWKELEEHFVSLERSIQKRLEDLELKERAFEAKMRETQEILDKREVSIASKEQASLTRVQEQKDAALAVILEERRRLKEEFDNGCEKVADDDTQKDSIKEKANGSVNANGSSVGDGPEADSKKEIIPSTKSEAKVQPQVRSQLKTLCETMDSKGLRKYIIEHRKDAAGLRNEVPSALNSAIDPSRLVLESLDGFYSPEQKSSDKKESGLPALRRACTLLLESLVPVLADPVLGVEHPVLPSNIKEQAKGIADEWKSKINLEGDVASGNSLEAQAFLQLLATFSIASEFDKDELCKLVLAVARRRQTPELCRSLGLESKMPDVVETLVNSGRQIEAVNFAHAFGLTEKFPPVPLLKEYLKDAKKASQASLKSGNNSTAAQNEANTKELSAAFCLQSCYKVH